jgi:hypothetical protein
VNRLTFHIGFHNLQLKASQDGILGHQFKKGLKSFPPSYSQSLFMVDFIENHSLLWF